MFYLWSYTEEHIKALFPLCFLGQHQNQHVQLGEDPQAELQAQTFPHKATRQSWGEDLMCLFQTPWMGALDCLCSIFTCLHVHILYVSVNVNVSSSLHVRTHWSSPWPVEMCVNPSGRRVWSTTPSSDWPRNRRQYTKRCCPVKAPALDTGKHTPLWFKGALRLIYFKSYLKLQLSFFPSYFCHILVPACLQSLVIHLVCLLLKHTELKHRNGAPSVNGLSVSCPLTYNWHMRIRTQFIQRCYIIGNWTFCKTFCLSSKRLHDALAQCPHHIFCPRH